MTSSTLYTRRLMKSELEAWLHLEKDTTAEEYDYAKAFLDLPDSMFFIATIDAAPVGGTAVYRDKTRLGMALVAAKLKEDFRKDTALHLLKSSLPFFKTVSIRDVDALVGRNDTTSSIPFSLDFTLPSWTRPALETMGFQKVAKTYGITIESGRVLGTDCPVTLDTNPDHDGARELLWNQRKNIGLSCSQQWLAFDMSKARKTLKTMSFHGETCLAVGVEPFRSGSLIPFFVTSPEILSSTMAAEAFLRYFSADRVIFSLVGEGQKETIEAVRNMCNSDSVFVERSLFRKAL